MKFKIPECDYTCKCRRESLRQYARLYKNGEIDSSHNFRAYRKAMQLGYLTKEDKKKRRIAIIRKDPVYQAIIKDYKNNVPMTEIVEKYGKCDSQIYVVLKFLGIPFRQKPEQTIYKVGYIRNDIKIIDIRKHPTRKKDRSGLFQCQKCQTQSWRIVRSQSFHCRCRHSKTIPSLDQKGSDSCQ